jgi:aminopeptidase
MSDPRVVSLARVMTEYSVGVRPGDQVAIIATSAGAPLVREVYRQVLLRGGHPLVMADVPGIQPIFLRTASDEQLRYISPVSKLISDTFDVRIRIESESNTRELTGVDPARQAIHAEATGPLLETILDRSARGEMRWVVALYPTDATAQDAEMSLEEFEDFVYEACRLNDPDPVASWRALRERQQVLVDWLQDKKEIRIMGPDTDLRVGVAGRTWINCFGDCNMPDGEVYTGPVEAEVNGTVRFSYPAIYEGREVEDVRLWFENGVIVKESAGKNQAFLTKMLNTDEGARRVGEFALGTHFGIQQFVKNILFDEKIGGTIHMAMGAGYPESGSANRSAIHWDMICDLRRGGEVTVDGQLFAKDGRFLLWDAERSQMADG